MTAPVVPSEAEVAKHLRWHVTDEFGDCSCGWQPGRDWSAQNQWEDMWGAHLAEVVAALYRPVVEQAGRDRQRADHFETAYEIAATGGCPHGSGMTILRCKGTDTCDCFDFEHLRATEHKDAP